MTSKEFLDALKWELKSLPVEEQDEAMEYYNQYFDEALSANDEKGNGKETEEALVERITKELGSPAEIAKEVMDKFASVPATREKAQKAGAADEETDGHDSRQGAFKGSGIFDDEDFPFTSRRKRERASERAQVGPFSCEAGKVRNVEIRLSAAEVMIVTGETYGADARGPLGINLNFELSENGTLFIDNMKSVKQPFYVKSKGGKGSRIAFARSRVLITVPKDAEVESFGIEMSAGNLRTKDVSIRTGKAAFVNNAGNLQFTGIKSPLTYIEGNVGNLEVAGELTGNTKITCNVGEVKVTTTTTSHDTSISEQIKLGSIWVNGNEHSAFSDKYQGTQKENHIHAEVNCGSIKIEVGRN